MVKKRAAADEGGIGHNSGDQAAEEEAQRLQLQSIVIQVEKADEAVEKTKAPFDAAKKARNTIFRLAKAAGFMRQEIEARMEEMKAPTHENIAKAQREAKYRNWLGIVTPEQQDMFASTTTPAEVKDEAHWRAEGYKAGLRGLIAEAPEGCGARFVQPFLEGHESGTKDSLAAIAVNAPKKMAEAKPKAEKPKPAEVVVAVQKQAAEDFEADEAELAAQRGRPQRAEVPSPEEIDAQAKKLRAKGFLDS